MRILVVEDEIRMAGVLRKALQEEGHAVTLAVNGPDAISICEAGDFDLIVLDIMLPGCSGLEVTRRLRAKRNQTPILILTARDTAADVVQGLDIGADDYLTKPFSLDVLFARVRAIGRRGSIAQPLEFSAAGLVLNQGTREVRRGDRVIDLTRTEYAILETLMRSAGRVVTRDSLISSVWGGDSDIESNTVDSFVRLLRLKIEEPGQDRIIKTIRGIGYALNREGS